LPQVDLEGAAECDGIRERDALAGEFDGRDGQTRPAHVVGQVLLAELKPSPGSTHVACD